MVIVGAKGLAKEVVQILESLKQNKSIYFFDDVNIKDVDNLFDKYTILRTEQQVLVNFGRDKRFLLALGKPKLRLELYNRFVKLGGFLEGVISKGAYIGEHVVIGKGPTIMSGVKISNGVSIGKALLAYYNVIITHDVKIGDFVELSPGCILLGHVRVEDEVQIGAGAIVLPNIKIGAGTIVGAGAVVTKNIEPNTVVAGVPARKIACK